jgi:hypothetical protein
LPIGVRAPATIYEVIEVALSLGGNLSSHNQNSVGSVFPSTYLAVTDSQEVPYVNGQNS